MRSRTSSDRTNSAIDQHRQAGFSLMEIIVTLSLMATLAMISAGRLSEAALSAVSNQASAKTMAMDVARIRRLSILKGQPHGIRFKRGSGSLSGYEVFQRRPTGSTVIVEKLRAFSGEATVSADRSEVEFDVQGAATTSCRIEFKSPQRTWNIHVVPVTGRAILTEVATK